MPYRYSIASHEKLLPMARMLTLLGVTAVAPAISTEKDATLPAWKAFPEGKVVLAS